MRLPSKNHNYKPPTSLWWVVPIMTVLICNAHTLAVDAVLIVLAVWLMVRRRG
jgi:hypothetical protein